MLSSAIANVDTVRYLNVSNNFLTGTVPFQLSILTTISQSSFLVSNTQLSGTLPTALAAAFPIASTSWSATCMTGGVVNPNPGCSLTEWPFLVDFFTATSGTSWTNFTNWMTSSHPCTWNGVSCSSPLGPVTSLVFSSNNLVGTVPSSISLLTAIATVDIGGSTTLTGSLPATIGALTTLQSLAFSACRLSGTLPSSLGALTALWYLNLHANYYLSGPIPSSFSALRALQVDD